MISIVIHLSCTFPFFDFYIYVTPFSCPTFFIQICQSKPLCPLVFFYCFCSVPLFYPCVSLCPIHPLMPSGIIPVCAPGRWFWMCCLAWSDPLVVSYSGSERRKDSSSSSSSSRPQMEGIKEREEPPQTAADSDKAPSSSSASAAASPQPAPSPSTSHPPSPHPPPPQSQRPSHLQTQAVDGSKGPSPAKRFPMSDPPSHL